MSWLFSQALEAEFLAASSLDGAPSAPSKPTPTPLCARQNDGLLPPFPIWDDVCTFDGRPWRGIVDVVSGGFPCQDISVAGKGAGINGSRSGLWGEMARIIDEVRPEYAFVENVPVLTSRGLGRVLGDLAEMGFDAKWGVLGAADVGAQHQRDRIWIVADARSRRCRESQKREIQQVADANSLRESQSERSKQDKRGWIGDSSKDVADARHDGSEIGHAQYPELHRQKETGDAFAQREIQATNTSSTGLEGWKLSFGATAAFAGAGGDGWWSTEPDVGRMANGVDAGMDRLRCIGNGQVPQCAAAAWRLLTAERREG